MGPLLVELFQDKLIGVKPKMVYEIDHAFFDEFRREGWVACAARKRLPPRAC